MPSALAATFTKAIVCCHRIRSLQALLNDPRNLPYLHLGCQGPDFMFFNPWQPVIPDPWASFNSRLGSLGAVPVPSP